MATIITRSGKGSPLTNTEVDANFTNLNSDKLESGDTVASLTITSADINGGTIDGTVIGGASAAAGTFTDVGADALDLAAIAETKAVTAVDVFVYDTSKDSDGGAWRKRTQHTSWYNETLNTATRGSRREFPAVAVIVAEDAKVTIYDGDDPALPMWMVFNLGGYNYYTVQNILGTSNSGTSVKSVVMFNGDLTVGVGATAQSGVRIIKFISDSAETNDGASPAVLLTDISYRNTDGFTKFGLSGADPIVNGTVNDVAMTVLPDAPIDPATGSPKPSPAS